MRVLKIARKNLPEFVEAISIYGEVWGPVKSTGTDIAVQKPGPRKEQHVYQKVRGFSDMELSSTRTIIPPKSFFHPPNFNMFKFSMHGYFEDFTSVTPKILFGVHPCDLHALLILDKLFTRQYPDPYWLVRREKTYVIGHSCLPDEKCFCLSTGTLTIEEGFDLFFTDLGDFYLVWVGSSKGDDLYRLKAELFQENVQLEDIQKFIAWKEQRDDLFKLKIPFTALPDLMEFRYNDPLWEDIATSCLSCGSCSMVCPSCNCYNVTDKIYIHNDEGERTRCWDSCMLKEYSLVAGGHNFRQKKSDRLKLWYTHKLQAFISAYGKYACVGCGRCITTCPVDINVETVAAALGGERVDAFWRRMNSGTPVEKKH
jgi:sulfhydrogenase subunit beta (sulfur reductase)